MVELRAMLHEKATNARELVCLRRQNDDIEIEVGKVLPRKFETRVVGIVNIDNA